MYPTINIFGFPVDTYTICFTLSAGVLFAAVILLRPKEFSIVRVFWITLGIYFFACLGAATLNILLNASKYEGKAIDEIFNTSGMAYLGAPFLAFLVIWIFCKNINVSFLWIADYAAPFFMLERVIGRLGCLLYGCCHGIPSRLPWAYPFMGRPPKHPTQAYEIIYTLAIFVSSRYLYKRSKDIRGVTFFYVILCYSFFRFFNDLLRAEGPFINGPFKLSHIVLFVFAVISITGLFVISKNKASGKEALKILKSAIVRLFIWIFAAGAIILLILSFIIEA